MKPKRSERLTNSPRGTDTAPCFCIRVFIWDGGVQIKTGLLATQRRNWRSSNLAPSLCEMLTCSVFDWKRATSEHHWPKAWYINFKSQTLHRRRTRLKYNTKVWCPEGKAQSYSTSVKYILMSNDSGSARRQSYLHPRATGNLQTLMCAWVSNEMGKIFKCKCGKARGKDHILV